MCPSLFFFLKLSKKSDVEKRSQDKRLKKLRSWQSDLITRPNLITL